MLLLSHLQFYRIPHPSLSQMIMGAGKTTVVGPLLAMLLANSSTLMLEVVPPALLDFSAGVLRERFSAAIRKPVFTFTFDRSSKVTPQLLSKLKTARNLRAIVVSSPSSIKSFMLKFIEICHNLSRQRHLALEKTERKVLKKPKSLVKRLLGILALDEANFEGMTPLELASSHSQAILADKIFEIFRSSIEIMDEVDVILHPLKSELNWPLGAKEPLDFTRSRSGNGLRWSIPSHLLDAIFSCCGMPVLADIAESKAAGEETPRYHAFIHLNCTSDHVIYPLSPAFLPSFPSFFCPFALQLLFWTSSRR